MLKLRSSWLFCALVSGWAALAPQPAAACSEIAPQTFEVDASLAQEDSRAPAPFRAITASTRRVAGEHCKNGTCISTSCGDTGYVELRFDPPRDDEAGADVADLGYRVVWLSGKMPEAMRGEIGVLRPLNAGGSMTLDVGFAGITELDGELALVAVDRAGNESEPSEAVRVQWSGCTEYFDEPACAAVSSNCSLRSAPGTRSHAGLWLWSAGLIGLGLGQRARRRRAR